MDVRNDKHFQEFLNIKNYKTESQKSAIIRLNLYCTYLNKTPTQLIEEAEIEEDNRLRMKNRKIKRYLTDFLKFLIEENYSENYTKAVIGSIRGFYREFDIELPRQIIRLQSKNNKFTTDDIIQREHIQKAVELSNPKWKAIILTMASSGMGSGELRSLTMDDFKNGLSEIGVKQSSSIGEIREIISENKDHIITWKIARVKTGYPYYCFSSPEALSSIINYIIDKKVEGSEYLFTSQRGNQLNPTMITYGFSSVNRLCNFGYVDNRVFFHSHGLRSFFASTLYKAGLSQLTIDFFLGHQINPVTGAYFKRDIPLLKEEYLKVLPLLSFIEPVETRVLTTDDKAEFEQMKKDLKHLQSIIDDELLLKNKGKK